ncbi:monooxygenase [Annulohypoxylon nitens]|nr:monooxygenase [Annulohypoxylon nitens]
MDPTAIIIGAGPSGIALAHKLKHTLGYENFTIYEKLDGVGGTWRLNNYPGCGCDVASHLYSFSFNLNPNWSRELCEQAEILQYIEDTVDKFDLRQFIQTSIECVGAKWNSDHSEWEVQLKDLKTGIEFVRRANIFVSAVGGISFPRDVHFEGMEDFKGPIFHTARWDHSVNYKGKRMAVIGNGCSAAQVVPSVADHVKVVKQYARSPQWYHDRPNHVFTEGEKMAFRYIPFLIQIRRLLTFLEIDFESYVYRPTPKGIKARLKKEEEARQYIYKTAPKKYHEMLVPKFELGCKRKIADPQYLECLHKPTVELVPEGIERITEDGIVSSTGKFDKFDIIVLATGFKVSQFLTPMEIIGVDGKTLDQQWKESRGAQAYLGTFVHNFPNLAIIFGPNTFPANNSALFACEVQVDYAVKALFAPLIDKRAKVIEVQETVENRATNVIHARLRNTVFQGNCSNWYLSEFGRNAASWPDTAASFWAATYFPKWKAFNMTGGSQFWFINSLLRNVRTTSSFTKALVLALLAVGLRPMLSQSLNTSNLSETTEVVKNLAGNLTAWNH